MFLESRRENKRLWTEWQQALPEFNFLLISEVLKSYENLLKHDLHFWGYRE
jgi:hypothetical protein